VTADCTFPDGLCLQSEARAEEAVRKHRKGVDAADWRAGEAEKTADK